MSVITEENLFWFADALTDKFNHLVHVHDDYYLLSILFIVQIQKEFSGSSFLCTNSYWLSKLRSYFWTYASQQRRKAERHYLESQ
jgi:hypothetical protein